MALSHQNVLRKYCCNLEKGAKHWNAGRAGVNAGL